MHNPIERRSGDIQQVNDVPGPWIVCARLCGTHHGDGSVIGTYGDRSAAVAAAMLAAHGPYYGAPQQHNQVTIRHANAATERWPSHWSANWRNGDDVWHEYGRVNDRGWTYAGRHEHAVRMAAAEPPERDPAPVGAFVGNRPVVTVDGHRYALLHAGGGVFTVLRPDGVIGYVAPRDIRDHGGLVKRTAEMLAEPDPNAVCPMCGAGRGQYCRPVAGEPGHTTDIPPYTPVRVDQVAPGAVILGPIATDGTLQALTAGRGPLTGQTRTLTDRRPAATTG